MNVVQLVGGRLSAVSERWLPDPFLFALVLTYVVFLAGIGLLGRTPIEMLQFWYAGFWSLLRFGMQMVLILATGFVLAYHPRVQRGLERLARLPRSGRGAVVVVGAVSMLTAWVHWGLGLVVGAVFAREMGRQADERGLDVHYPVLCVAGYLGIGLTWHWGLSGSAPVLLNTPHNLFIGLGVVDGVLPPSRTIFHPYTLAVLAASVAAALVLLSLLAPPAERSAGIRRFVPEAELVGRTDAPDRGEAYPNGERRVPADYLDHSRVVGALVALGGLGMTAYAFGTSGLGALTFDVINFGLLFVGLALFTSPKAYQEEFYAAVRSTGGIILQFPFYAGIMGMMNQSGLSTVLATSLLAPSTASTYPAAVVVAGGVVNVFVPSGGAEWMVIGEPVLRTARELGVPPGQAVVAFGAGDAVGNLVQPFWAIPLIGITGVRARELFGYAAALLLFLVPFLALLLVTVPY